MATIRKRGGKWQVQVRRHGRPPVSRSFISYADAERWGRETEVAMERCELQGDISLLRRLTLGDLLSRYRDEVSPTKRSAATERYRLNLMMKHRIGRLGMDVLSRQAIAAYRDEQLAKLSTETVRQYLVLLRQVIETARREWDLPLASNPVDGVRRPAGAKARTRRVGSEELDRLRQGLGRLRRGTMGDVVAFALATGMRRSEILAATWKEVDRRTATLVIPKTKNGEPRTIPLSPAALAVLERQSKRAEDAPIFPISPNAVKLAWRRLCLAVGVPDLRFHDLRHEAVSRFFEMGLSVPEVSLISGHKDVRMLMRYTHLKPRDLALKLQVLDRQAPR